MSVLRTTTEVLERLSAKYEKTIIVLPDAGERLRRICTIVDEMISEFDAETYTVSVIPDDLTLEINVIVPEMIIEDCSNHSFFKLVELVDSFGLSTEDDNLNLSLNINNIFCIER